MLPESSVVLRTHQYQTKSGGDSTCLTCGWREGYHLHTDNEVLIDRFSMGSIPYDAKWQVATDYQTNQQHILFSWDQRGRTAAVRIVKTPYAELIEDDEGNSWWYPYQAAPPPEPASLFAKRELTVDELLDPDLFNPLHYESMLSRLVKPEPLPEYYQPLKADVA